MNHLLGHASLQPQAEHCSHQQSHIRAGKNCHHRINAAQNHHPHWNQQRDPGPCALHLRSRAPHLLRPGLREDMLHQQVAENE